MLPRVAPTTGTTQPTPALTAGASVDAAAKPPLSAAALANLRAEVVLRLIETLLKHMPRTGEASPNRDLLETLLTVLKTLPGREGESGRKLADLLAKLPPEMRPAVEKLISTVLMAAPTRTLVEIVRNPNGPEAQKLAILLATNLTAEDRHTTEGHTSSAQKPAALTAQQLAVVGRHSLQQATQMAQLLSGDARTLQAMLKRVFDFDGGSKPRGVTDQPAGATAATAKTEKAAAFLKAESALKTEAAAITAKAVTAGKAEIHPTTTARTELAGTIRQPNETPVTQRALEGRPVAAAPVPVVADDPPLVDTLESVKPQQVDSQEPEHSNSATIKREEPPVRQPIATSAGQALARSVLQAVARDLPPALLTAAVIHLVENLSPEEATFLRTLLERPLDFVLPPDVDLTENGLPPVVEPEAEAITAAEQGADMVDADISEETARLRHDPTQTAAVPARAAPVLTDEARPAQRLAENAAAPAQAATQLDLPLATMVAREGIPLAFVPYLPAEDDLEWSEAQEAEKDEDADEDGSAGEQGSGEENAHDTAEDGEESETPDIARRREKMAEMVGVIEPGLVFYQKLGDYST
ncbi:hypothetical protein D0Y60_06955 [Shinella sp. WSJ-2]|uniref:hypothetical protein n=1 Tax=Shinella sp. WSJ-2 TaxID=2303749 RepID=UPI000E3D66DA|nr:hypothetical protein [Shinella sp. WSJ-2]RFZ88882.1 hypothetical protein D0Y60_06955 [Shinella sp. WSJ-2]